MNVSAQKENTSLAISEQELMLVLKNSLYPGAQDDSIKLVLGYCKASGLDPMHKPVHIVPMYDSKIGRYRDLIMPGIGLYRTQAARSGEYAGVSDAEYGPDVTETLSGVQVTYPSWAKVTVRRLLKNGQIAEFTATERWKENYAVKGGKEQSIAPNSMWAKRPYAQLAKCAEGQALRKAFPEFGAQPTADEMEGKEIEINAPQLTKSQPKHEAANLDFEAQYLPMLEEAADFGTESLTQAFQLVPKCKDKSSLWATYGNRLKERAMTADEKLIEEGV